MTTPPGNEGTLTDDVGLAFFHLIHTVHLQALHKAGGYQDRFFSIGGKPVRLRFAGGGLIPLLTQALAHVEIPPTPNPALTILCWDSASSGAEMPRLLTQLFESLGQWWLHLGRRGEIKELTSARIRTAYHLGPNIFSTLDMQENLGMYWVKDARELPYYEPGSPLRTLLHWWADNGACQFVHGGAVGLPAGGVLLAGKGGSGKSTTALACLEAGLLYASDDYCLVQAEPEPYVFSVYNTVKLRGEADLQRFPRLAPLVSNTSRTAEDKAVIFLQEHFPAQVCHGFPLRAIFLPRIGHETETRLERASGGAALAALAPSTLFQLPGAGGAAFKTMSNLVRRIPAFHLTLGSDMARIPETILTFLSQP